MNDQQPPTQPGPFAINPAWLEQAAVRAERREERESETGQYQEAYRLTERGAIDLAQSTLRLGVTVNAGGLIAIPATVTLFHLNVDSIRASLLWVCVAFGLGVLCSWVATLCAYFSLAERSEGHWQIVTMLQRKIDASFDPQSARQHYDASAAAGAKASACFGNFRYLRIAAIVLALLGVVAFVAGAAGGAYAITSAHRLQPTYSRS